MGEGGGQIVRTCLALAAVTGRPLVIENVRARRANPGLAAQHLTAVRAVGAICAAEIEGDALGSQTLRFTPRRPPAADSYLFDVSEARPGGSAGAITLLAQTILLPLAFAHGPSRAVLRGGTHVPWSPPFDYGREVWLFALARMGIEAQLELARFGFYPAGGGEIRLEATGPAILRPLTAVARGEPKRVTGRAVAANLPAHIAQRMADRARSLIMAAGMECALTPVRVTAVCPGAGIFLTLESEGARAGFSALGRPGKPAEVVAEEAVADLLAYRDSGAALDRHLADQIILPAALASGVSEFTAERVTGHLRTCAAVVEHFGLARTEIAGSEEAPGKVTVIPAAGA